MLLGLAGVMIGRYLRRNLRFRRVTHPEPSMHFDSILVELTNLDDSTCFVPSFGEVNNLVLDANMISPT